MVKKIMVLCVQMSIVREIWLHKPHQHMHVHVILYTYTGRSIHHSWRLYSHTKRNYRSREVDCIKSFEHFDTFFQYGHGQR